jgi:hypothetical protein
VAAWAFVLRGSSLRIANGSILPPRAEAFGCTVRRPARRDRRTLPETAPRSARLVGNTGARYPREKLREAAWFLETFPGNRETRMVTI